MNAIIRAASPRSLLCALLCGTALALCLPRPGLCALAWVAWAPLLVALTSRDKPSGTAEAVRAAALGGLAGFAFFGVSLHWIYLTCRFAGVPVWASILAWSALSAFEALTWAVFGVLVRRCAGGAGAAARPWAVAALWAAVEFAGMRFTPRVGGDLMAYTQWRWLPWIQGGSWAGPHGLGFIILAWNAALAELWREHRGPKRREAAAALALSGALALGWWGWGFQELASERRTSGPSIKAALLQPNIDQYQKWDKDYAPRIRARFDVLLSSAAAAAPDLIVWPETSLPGWLDDPDNLGWAAGWARRSRTRHIIGALTRIGGVGRNSAVLLDPAGAAIGLYHKRQLVPFGEYVPLRSVLAPLVGILAEMGDLAKGARVQEPFRLPWGSAAATICYEAAFPEWNRAGAALGARAIVNLTNDGWYKDTWGPYQHFYANVFRAVENRAAVLRAANTGISGSISPYGRVETALPLGEEGVAFATLPAEDPFPRRSFYARFGDWFGWTALAAAAVLGIRRLRRG